MTLQGHFNAPAKSFLPPVASDSVTSVMLEKSVLPEGIEDSAASLAGLDPRSTLLLYPVRQLTD